MQHYYNNFLMMAPYNGHMWPTRGPHELHSTGSTIMPLQINMRATCGTQVALSLSLIHDLQSHGIQVACHLNSVATCSRLWPLVATRGPLVKCLLGCRLSRRFIPICLVVLPFRQFTCRWQGRHLLKTSNIETYVCK